MATESSEMQVSHSESTLFAEPIFHVGDFTITNSLFFSWLSVFILVAFFIIVGKNVQRIPRGIQNFFEYIIENTLNFSDSITGSRKQTEKVFPVVFTLFIFILINNWMGLIPGVGTIGIIEEHEGHKLFVPLLRGGTADVNFTLAISLFAVVFSHVSGTLTVGIWNHFNKFVNVKTLLEIPGKIRQEKIIAFVNPIKFFVGIIEIVGEFAKVASLSLRLFGNIFAGEVLLASMMGIFAYFLPIPFMFMEIIVGIVQAMVFAILALAFTSIATMEMEH